MGKGYKGKNPAKGGKGGRDGGGAPEGGLKKSGQNDPVDSDSDSDSDEMRPVEAETAADTEQPKSRPVPGGLPELLRRVRERLRVPSRDDDDDDRF